MSWWTKNRGLVLPAAGLLALNLIPGVGQAASGALSTLTGGLLGTGEAGAAAMAAADAATAGGGAAELASVGETGGTLLGGAPPMDGTIAHNSAFNALRYANSPGEAMSNLGAWAQHSPTGPMNMGAKQAMQGMQGLSMMAPQPSQQPAMGPSPFRSQPMQQGPSNPIYGGGKDMMALLSDPMTPDYVKKQILAQMGGPYG